MCTPDQQTQACRWLQLATRGVKDRADLQLTWLTFNHWLASRLVRGAGSRCTARAIDSPGRPAQPLISAGDRWYYGRRALRQYAIRLFAKMATVLLGFRTNV